MNIQRKQYNRIQKVLDEKGMTVYWLQEQLRETAANVVRWSKNVNQPSVEILFEIARILDVDVRDLLVSTQIKHLREDMSKPVQKVLVDAKDHKILEDKRHIVPFVKISKYKNLYVNKIGLINKEGKIIVEPKYDVAVGDCYEGDDLIVLGSYYTMEDNPHMFCHYDVYTGEGDLLLGDVVDFVISADRKIITVFVNTEYEYGWGALNSKNNWLISPGKYDWISGFNKGYARVKRGKETNGMVDADVLWGIVNNEGLEVVPLEYYNIHNFCDDDFDSIKVERKKGGTTESITLGELSSIWRVLKAREQKAKEDIERENNALKQRIRAQEEEKYWETYGNSHSQYGGVFSDDAISDAFDGDPGACWNVD